MKSRMKEFLRGVAVLSVGAASFSVAAPGQSKVLVATPGTDRGPVVSKGHAGKAEEEHVRAFATDVHSGILTVDGLVGKAQLNYHIHEQYMYFTIPGVGTAIVSQTRFMNSLPQKGAFHGNTLTFQANGHTVELSNDNPLVAGKSADAWVAIDPLYGAGIAFPMMGYGDSLSRPYAWPGSKTETTTSNAYASAPPLPKALRPKPEIASSYSVTVPAQQPNR